MPIPVSALIGSPRRLVTAIVLFVALDLSVLVINLWLAEQLAQDAVAINLAGIISFSGKRVIVLDLDMRKPKIHLGFGVENIKGMSTLLMACEAVRAKPLGILGTQ